MDHYRLPSQLYKCGNSPSGESCPLGPSGGRCSRSQSAGQDGAACRPLRTLRWWSRSIQWCAALVALLGVSLAWSNLGGKRPIAPGSLSRSHAQLLISAQQTAQIDFAIDSENRCSACHPGLDGNPLAATQTQSELCMKCHVQEMPDAVSGSPHDLHGRALEELVARGNQREVKSSLVKWVSNSSFDWKESPTECSQCHREHQGDSHNLKEMTSQRCQACHQAKYQSFATDHPEFKDYPYGRVKNIAFDHSKHRDLHFSKKNASFDCKTCHLQSDQVGVVGQIFRSVPFEQACASCHSQPLRSSLQDGLIVLQIPSIQRNAMIAAGTDVGSWPEQASQLTDGVIPPMMRMLIESEPGGEALLRQLPESGQLSDLDIRKEQDRDTLLKLSTATKQLLRKLANEGQPGFRTSVERYVSTSSGPWLDQFANGLPPDLFRAAWYEWFEGKTVPSVSRAETHETDSSRPSSVRLSSTIRQADDDLLGGTGSLLNPKADGLLDGNPTNLLEPQGKDKLQSAEFKDTRAFDQLAYGGWMIDRQRMAIVYIPKGHADEWLSRWIELEEMRPSGNQPKTGLAQQCRQCHSLKSNSQANLPALQTTLLNPVVTIETQKRTNWSIAFRLANEEHKVGVQWTGVNAVVPNDCWRSSQRAPSLRPITKFDHTPHLTLPSISDCSSCHRLLAASSHENAEFAPMQKSQCASCHQQNAAGDSCTQCHNYHVGTKGWLGGYSRQESTQ